VSAARHFDRRQVPHSRSRLARALSKLGFCSRSQAQQLIAAGRVRVNGTIRRDPEWRVTSDRDRIEVDGQRVQSTEKIYLMLNKPRGLVTTASDEQGRSTVFECLADAELPFVAPVGRLDKASEGLLLFTNDTGWATRIADPSTHLDKTYHVQVNCVVQEPLLERMRNGVNVDAENLPNEMRSSKPPNRPAGVPPSPPPAERAEERRPFRTHVHSEDSATTDENFLKVKSARLLRQGTKTSWLEIVLDEGKNRHIRRLLSALGIDVLRLVRVAIGELQLGDVAKGKFRRLTASEVRHFGGW
jgi:23S rRNA pseudouridine2605 synthase